MYQYVTKLAYDWLRPTQVVRAAANLAPRVLDASTSAFPATIVASAIVAYEVYQYIDKKNPELTQSLCSYLQDEIIDPLAFATLPIEPDIKLSVNTVSLPDPVGDFDHYFASVVQDYGAYVCDPTTDKRAGITSYVCAAPTDLTYDIDDVNITIFGSKASYWTNNHHYVLTIINQTSGTFWRHSPTYSQFVYANITPLRYDLLLVKTTVVKTRPAWTLPIYDFFYDDPVQTNFVVPNYYSNDLGCLIMRKKDDVRLFHPNCIKQLEMTQDEFINFMQLRSCGRCVPGMFKAVRENADVNFQRLCALYDSALTPTRNTIEQKTLVYGAPGSTFDKVPGTPMLDLVGTTVVADHGINNEARCLKERLQALRSTGMDDVPDQWHSIIMSLTDSMFVECQPVPLKEFISALKPTVRRKYEMTARQIAYVFEPDYLHESFIKTESYGELKAPRNISAVSTAHVLSYSSYTRAISAHMKSLECYAFGKSPLDISLTVHSICEFASVRGLLVIETDFSKFDGTQGSFCKEIEMDILFRCFPNDDNARVYHAETMHALFKTQNGIQYSSGFTRLSGSADTSVFNTCINVYVNYLSLVLAGFSASEAYDLVTNFAIFGGDDGLIIDVGQGDSLEATVKTLGMSIKSNRKCPETDAVTFLGRVYPHANTSPVSFQDPCRFLTKMSFSDSKCRTEDELYARKLVSYLHTDYGNMIGRFADTWLNSHHLVRYRVPDDLYINPALSHLLDMDNRCLEDVLPILDTSNNYPSDVDDDSVLDRLLQTSGDTSLVSRFNTMMHSGIIERLAGRDPIAHEELFALAQVILPDQIPADVPDVVGEVNKIENEKSKENAFHRGIARFISKSGKLEIPLRKYRPAKICHYFKSCTHTMCNYEHIPVTNVCPYSALSRCTEKKCPYIHVNPLIPVFKEGYFQQLGILKMFLPHEVCPKRYSDCARAECRARLHVIPCSELCHTKTQNACPHVHIANSPHPVYPVK